MCTRDEIKFLLKELLQRIDQVALLSARMQFNEECESRKSYTHPGAEPSASRAADQRFSEIFRFQKAYLRYFVFANDQYTELIVPLSISSLSMFISNIITQTPKPSAPPAFQTSRTIIEFLQVNYRRHGHTHARTCCGTVTAAQPPRFLSALAMCTVSRHIATAVENRHTHTRTHTIHAMYRFR